MMRKKVKGKIDIPSIVEAMKYAEQLALSNDPDKKIIGESMKNFFQRLFEKKQTELRKAIEKVAKLKQKKIWLEKSDKK